MYIPKKTKKPINLFKVEYSRRSMMVAGVMIGGTILTALYLTLRDFQEKERLDKRHERRVKATYNPRVLIIGSGTGGAAMASLIANGYPEAQVTVVERERKQMFTAMLPLAQVGTRSYDLNSRSGVDYLRSPAAFNVTTEAELIMGEVLEVKPKDNCVIIKPESLNRREDASYTVLKDGTLSHPYDVLVVAGGAQRTLGHLRSYLKQEDIDTYKIAVNPGITRDVLSHMFGGNIIHVKVPPSSFIREKEKERARLKGKVETIEIGLTDTNSNSWENTPYRRLAQFGKVDTAEAQTKTQETVDYYPCRQHDGTFTGTVNMMWGYLDHVKKFPFITYIAATADDQPLGPAPSKVNQAIASFWKRCQANTPNDHFHVLRHSYVTDVDSKNNKVQLYNYKEKVNFILPYTLMLLDLPLLAPSFIQRSGLHRKELEKPVRGVSLEEESHFMDVDPQTLQHKTYPNIFGIGDVAGLPTIKSYGAVFAQLGVVLHNVGQELHNLKVRARIADEKEKYANALIEYQKQLKAHKEGPAPVQPEPPVVNHVDRVANARYDGYSSFHIPMKPWNAMWPEMLYNAQQIAQFGALKHAPSVTAKADMLSTATGELEYTDLSLWDNTSWEGIQGWCNAAYYRNYLYEIMYFFLFTGGMWFSKTGAGLPLYSVEDGTPLKPSFF